MMRQSGRNERLKSVEWFRSERGCANRGGIRSRPLRVSGVLRRQRNRVQATGAAPGEDLGQGVRNGGLTGTLVQKDDVTGAESPEDAPGKRVRRAAVRIIVASVE